MRKTKAGIWPLTLLCLKVFPLLQIGATATLPSAALLPFFNLVGFVFGVLTIVSAAAKKGSKAKEVAAAKQLEHQ
jgi:hypothetical protein